MGLLLGASPSSAAEQLGTPPPLTVHQGKFVTTEDEVVPLAWAYGLPSALEVPIYREAGFNVLYVDLPLPEGWTEADLDVLLAAAQEYGLWVILGLNTIEAVHSRGAIAPMDTTYREEAATWIEEMVTAYKDTPGLLGWGVQHEPEPLLHYPDAEFRTFLETLYPSPADLVQAWRMETLNPASLTLVGAIRSDDHHPPGFARPSLDVALYQQVVTQDLFCFWAQTIQALDPQRLVFTGRCSTYRTLATVPLEYQAIVPALYPTRAEPDWVTHNVQAVDMARRGNRFAAVPVLLSQPQARGPTPAHLFAWTVESFVHGAAGVAYQNWEGLKGDPQRLAAVKVALDIVRQSGLAAGRSTPTAAILYEPFAAGIRREGVPFYGYEAGLIEGEPVGLLTAFRRGTKYGQVDFLTLPEITALDLRRYRVLFAPAAFSLPRTVQRTLEQFVADGGVLVADLGAGAYERRGNLRYLPLTLARLFGLERLTALVPAKQALGEDRRSPGEIRAYERALEGLPIELPRRGSLSFPEAHPLFPSFRAGDFSSPLIAPDQSTWLGFALVRPETKAFGALRAYVDALTSRPAFAGIAVHRYRSGYGVFATFFLWERWRVGQRGFNAFHGDLLRRGATIELVNSRDPFPGPTEVARHGDTIVVYHRGSNAPVALIEVANLDRWLYPQGLNLVAWTPPAAIPLPSLTAVVPPQGRTGGGPLRHPLSFRTRLYLRLTPDSLHVLPPLPLQLTPHDATAAVQVLAYGPEGIALAVYGREALIQPDPRLGWRVFPRWHSRLTLTLRDGLYRIAPGSEHLLEIRTLYTDELLDQRRLVASPEGVVTITETVRGARMVIRPTGSPR